MNIAILLGGILVLAAVLYYLGRTAGRAYLRYRGTRVITCPENRRPAAVRVDVADAVVGAMRGSSGGHRLVDCSRWPEKQACGQQCLEEIELSPQDCLLRTMLTDWYSGKKCVLCRRPFAEIQWHDHKPCLMGPDGTTSEWRDFQPNRIPDVLETHRPVCWNCHVAETFRRTRPELVVDRDRPSART
jgi:hypothetical protein